MTDKQIIIDGVDVSGCPYYIHKDGSCSSHDCECVKCVHNVCLYKDYKAKEQECEELKIYIESNEQQVKEVETLVMDNDRLINELDQLKAENDTYKKMLEDEDVQLALTEIRSGERHLWRNKAEKLSKALVEIKEIAEKIEDECGYLGFGSCANKAKEQILQKISECEVENASK